MSNQTDKATPRPWDIGKYSKTAWGIIERPTAEEAWRGLPLVVMIGVEPNLCEQIVREHNEHDALCYVLQSAIEILRGDASNQELFKQHLQKAVNEVQSIRAAHAGKEVAQ